MIRNLGVFGYGDLLNDMSNTTKPYRLKNQNFIADIL
jgi:hypothetical protein